MKRKSVFIQFVVFSLALLCGMLLNACYNFADDLRGSIEGRVLLRNTEIPVKDVQVQIESLRDSSFFTVYTDEEGYFSFENLHFGVNKIEFSKNKFRDLVKYADIRADDVFQLDVELRASVPNKMIYTAVVVIDRETKLPIEKTIIDIYKYLDRDPDDDINGYWDYYSTMQTDENGFASAFLGPLARKGTIDLELRFFANGYEDKHINYTVYFETRQEIRTVDLVLYPDRPEQASESIMSSNVADSPKISDSPLWAAIDIGSNSTLLLICRLFPDQRATSIRVSDVYSLEPVWEQTITTRLGKGLEKTRKLDKLAIRDTFHAVEKYYKVCCNKGVPHEHIQVIGTQALRQADNTDVLKNLLREKLNLFVRVLTPREEAQAGWRGACMGISQLDYPLLVFDIGGGSTELIYQETAKHETQVVSVPLGCVTLSEQYELSQSPFLPRQQELTEHVRAVLANPELDLPIKPPTLTIGIGGTVTTLGSMYLTLPGYNAAKINNLHLESICLKKIYDELAPLTSEQRLEIVGLAETRADIIGPGLIINQEIIRKWSIPHFLISTWGIRHGILLDPLLDR